MVEHAAHVVKDDPLLVGVRHSKFGEPNLSIWKNDVISNNKDNVACVSSSIADLDEFWQDPDPTFENVHIRIRTLA
jgi:hypothetical protein